MRKREIMNLNMEEFINGIYEIKPQKVLRVALKEYDKKREKHLEESHGMLEHRFFATADFDIRKLRENGDGRMNFVISFPIDHYSGEGEIIGELCCSFNDKLTPSELLKFIKSRKEITHELYDEDTARFVGIIKEFVKKGFGSGNAWYDDIEWLEDKSEKPGFYQYGKDYDTYLKNSWQD